MDKGWSVKAMHLDVSAKVSGADPAKFQATEEAAKKNCPISRLLNTQITMGAKLACERGPATHSLTRSSCDRPSSRSRAGVHPENAGHPKVLEQQLPLLPEGLSYGIGE